MALLKVVKQQKMGSGNRIQICSFAQVSFSMAGIYYLFPSSYWLNRRVDLDLQSWVVTSLKELKLKNRGGRNGNHSTIFLTKQGRLQQGSLRFLDLVGNLFKKSNYKSKTMEKSTENHSIVFPNKAIYGLNNNVDWCFQLCLATSLREGNRIFEDRNWNFKLFRKIQNL